MSKIISIGTVVQKYGIKQSEIVGFMHETYNNEVASRKLSILFHHSGFDKRYSVLPDFGKSQQEQMLFKVNPSAPTIERRLSIYKKHAVSLAIEAIQDSLLNLNSNVSAFNPTHLITVSCTELYAANEIVLIATKKLNITPSSINKWAIHPEGKKILDTLKKQLQKWDVDLMYSYKVLAEYGNMSSSTILFVLNEILKTAPKSGETIFFMGFGPGLSIDTCLFTYAQ